ncbi:MAG: hypothetical protein QXJ97_11165 [Desulfurococcaceae archaeon]
MSVLEVKCTVVLKNGELLVEGFDKIVITRESIIVYHGGLKVAEIPLTKYTVVVVRGCTSTSPQTCVKTQRKLSATATPCEQWK